MKRLMIVVNAAEFFLSHRMPIALAAKEAGYDVHVACPPGKGVDEIKNLGFYCHALPLFRKGQNPIKELSTIVKLAHLLHKVKPDVLHLVTIKPVLYGGLVARILGNIAVVAAITGLGTVFNPKNTKERIRKRVVALLYRIALKQNRLMVIFQNANDRDIICRVCDLSAERIALIRGSGVDLENFYPEPEPEGTPVVAMAARLLHDKGVGEFVAAAKILSARNVEVEMLLAGQVDEGNPTSVSKEEIENWRSIGNLKILGHIADIAELYAASNIACLPSYHEGLPKSLIEAAASGRAVVTTDVPGCRDAIEAGRTGMLVPAGNAEALASAIEALIKNPTLRRKMGVEGRRLAEDAFALKIVIQKHLEIYRAVAIQEREK
jgi:glycosyltransferase involved in cell wall biosynthesis